MVSIDEFKKVDLKVGTVLEAGDIEGSEKLLKLKVDLDEETPRQILSGIKAWYKAEDLIGIQVVVVTNLEPKMIMGLESQGMILASGDEDGPTILSVVKPVKNGSKIS